MSFQVTIDLYNRIFQQQLPNPEVQVDYEVWTRINNSLPAHYSLPDNTIFPVISRIPE
ncbi:hypothetical protein ACFOQM_12275 [Paenibacillus sp. GCM10012307]|uniref:Uncharacterized protein n=1 Tax=Paenibacillus roseus TaxID=2798579 RepID=A0A934MVF5_9BACL|nr:hypothetical protein [Paenibacillus roseus]MBJ6362067.1 hypothetical protein [Paenibacillus roseus]